MGLHTSNSIALARTNIGAAIDNAMSDVMGEPLREIMSLLKSGDIDSTTALIDDTMEECHDPLIKDHLHKAYGYLQDIS
tara:strand:- start:1043 stop:1279 length:237 start_codon:yes stop_codon:yes gene_type:complete